MSVQSDFLIASTPLGKYIGGLFGGGDGLESSTEGMERLDAPFGLKRRLEEMGCFYSGLVKSEFSFRVPGRSHLFCKYGVFLQSFESYEGGQEVKEIDYFSMQNERDWVLVQANPGVLSWEKLRPNIYGVLLGRSDPFLDFYCSPVADPRVLKREISSESSVQIAEEVIRRLFW